MRRFLTVVSLVLLVSVGWAQGSPFGDQAVQPVGTPSGTTIPTHLETLIPTPEPTLPADPMASATPDARDAAAKYEQILQKIKDNLAAKDYKAASEALAYLNRLAKDSGSAKKPVKGLLSRMSTGGVDGSRLAALKGQLSTAKNKLYSEMTTKLLTEADSHEGYKTSSGPGGGNVACAWLMSIVLRAAGLVPPGWNENVAVQLTRRLMSEFGWAKVPSTGNSDSGSVKTSAMKPGDIVFWSPSDHVGVYLGDGMAFSNSSSSHKGAIHPVSGYYDGWKPRYVVRAPGGA